ncbi:hypothetical protein KIPB_009227, partial [Kipferlia bialata]
WMHEMGVLMAGLAVSDKPISTSSFTSALGWDSLDTHMQQDIGELLHLVHDRLTSDMASEDSTRLKELTTHTITTYVMERERTPTGTKAGTTGTPKRKGHKRPAPKVVSSSAHQSLTLNVPVKGQTTLLGALSTALSPTPIESEGDTGPKRYTGESLQLRSGHQDTPPQTLMIAMRRVGVDPNTYRPIKYPHPVSIPFSMDIEPLFTCPLGQTPQFPSAPPQSPPFSPSLFEYKLAVAVIHSGTASHGHYYALANMGILPHGEAEGEKPYKGWLLFNDRHVREISPAQVHKIVDGEGKSKSESAVMLYYTRTIDTRQWPEKIEAPPKELVADHRANEQVARDLGVTVPRTLAKGYSSVRVITPLYMQQHLKGWGLLNGYGCYYTLSICVARH